MVRHGSLFSQLLAVFNRNKFDKLVMKHQAERYSKYLDPPLPGPNPCLVERMPEIRQPRYVPSEEDFWKVYEVAERQDRVMLLTFLHLAARRGEIFRLTLGDVDFRNNRVRLWTRKRKGGFFKFDWLPMTQELRKTLHDFP